MANEINPASMIVAPHLKPRLESETKVVGGPGDPRGGIAAIHSGDTAEDGTETPWRDTPPHNMSSVAETQNDHSPPTDPDIDPEDADSKPEVIVPPEEELP
jgi:hypothetical protein